MHAATNADLCNNSLHGHGVDMLYLKVKLYMNKNKTSTNLFQCNTIAQTTEDQNEIYRTHKFLDFLKGY